MVMTAMTVATVLTVMKLSEPTPTGRMPQAASKHDADDSSGQQALSTKVQEVPSERKGPQWSTS